MTPHRMPSSARAWAGLTLAVATLAPTFMIVAPAGTAAASPALAGTALAAKVYRYPYPSAPDCNEGVGPATGCAPDRWGYYQGQCTSWVAFRINDQLGVPLRNWYRGVHFGGAGNWINAARALHLRVDGTPSVGAIAAFPGHVGYVERVYPGGLVQMTEMNYNSHNAFHYTYLKRGKRWPTAFIHMR